MCFLRVIPARWKGTGVVVTKALERNRLPWLCRLGLHRWQSVHVVEDDHGLHWQETRRLLRCSRCLTRRTEVSSVWDQMSGL
jgi:hypothetical protein